MDNISTNFEGYFISQKLNRKKIVRHHNIQFYVLGVNIAIIYGFS